MTTVYPTNYDFSRAPVGKRASFSEYSSPVSDHFDAERVIAGDRARSSSTPINLKRVSVGTRSTNFEKHASVGDRAQVATDSYFDIPLPPAPADSFPVFIPDQNADDSFLPTTTPFQTATQDTDANEFPPETLSGDEPSIQDVKADFSDLLDPIAKVQKKMKLGSIAMAVIAVALVILGLALIVTGSAAGLLPFAAALPLLYSAFNGYRVSENLDRIIKNPDQIISTDQAIQMDSQKIKQSLKEKTFYFDWAIDKGTDYLLNSANPSV